MHIDFSSKQVRAALCAVFSAKTYNRLVSKISRIAFATMTSIQTVARVPFATKKDDSDKQLGEIVDAQHPFKPKTEGDRAAQKNSSYLCSFSNRSKEIIKLLTDSSGVIWDIANGKSTHNIGLNAVGEVYQLIHMPEDENCYFSSLTFGMLHQLVQLPPSIREQAALELIYRAKGRIKDLRLSQSTTLQEIAAHSKTINAQEIIQQVITHFAMPPSDEPVADWLEVRSQSLPFINALRRLTALSRIDLQFNGGLELFDPQLAVKSFDAQTIDISDYLEKMGRSNSANEQMAYGTNAEIWGFAHLFDLSVHLLPLSSIGECLKRGLSPADAIEMGSIKFTHPHSLTPFSPILIVSSRFHCNAALKSSV